MEVVDAKDGAVVDTTDVCPIYKSKIFIDHKDPVSNKPCVDCNVL